MGFNDLRKRNPSTSAAGGPASFQGPLTTFGEVSVSQLTPVAQGDFVYNNINDQIFNEGAFSGGSVSANDGMAVLSSGTDANGSAIVQLRRGLKYKSGQGSLMRATALFGSPEPGNAQFIGLGNSECGYFIGYFGGFFGILHSEDGSREIRKLTVATGAGTGNVTITLDGDSISVPVVGGLDATQTAYQISRANYRQVGNGGWLADAIGDSVYFLSARSGPANGAYSATGAGIVAAFSQIKAGEAQTNTFIPSSDFNFDKLDGTGPSGMVLNPQVGNVYQIGFQYLGFGNAKFAVEDPETGLMTDFHQIKNANNRTTPVLKNPNASILATSANIGGTTSVELRTASMAAFTEGKVTKLDPKYAISFSFSGINSATYVPLALMKANRVFNGQSSFGEFDLLQLAGSNEVNNKTLTIGLFINKSVSGDVNYQNVDSLGSIVSFANLDPSTQTITAPIGNPFYELVIGSASSKTIDLAMMGFVFGPGTELLIAIKTTASMAGSVSINWFEQQ